MSSNASSKNHSKTFDLFVSVYREIYKNDKLSVLEWERRRRRVGNILEVKVKLKVEGI